VAAPVRGLAGRPLAATRRGIAGIDRYPPIERRPGTHRIASVGRIGRDPGETDPRLRPVGVFLGGGLQLAARRAVPLRTAAAARRRSWT